MPATSTTASRAPCRTPATLTAVRSSSGTTMRSERPQPDTAPCHTPDIAWANPADRLAATVTRATQVIQATSKPTSSPNASRV